MRPPWSPEHSEPRWTWRWLQSFWPAPVTVNSRERLRVVLGAGPVNLAAAAVALTIAVMFAPRSLHPPEAGATALLIVLSGATDPVVALARGVML
ncbi:MAG: HPP family protein [Burkholderiaceae bacterium]|nr:HPP family protein [Burkholderiaceae bacterium]